MRRTARHLSGLKISVVAIGVLLLVVSVSGQHPGCSDLVIKAPDGQYPWHPFEASLVLTDRQRAEIRDVRWTITKHNTASNKKEVETVINALAVETRAWDANEPGYIQWLVVGRVGDCVSAGFSSSTALPNPGTPYVIDEFGELPVNDVKGRIDLAIADMKERFANQELIIFAEFSPRTTWKTRRQKVQGMLDHIVGFRKLDARRLTFVLSEGAHTRFRLQPVPTQLLDIYTGYGTMTIPADRFNEFARFFK